jgi:hypothetical protein
MSVQDGITSTSPTVARDAGTQGMTPAAGASRPAAWKPPVYQHDPPHWYLAPMSLTVPSGRMPVARSLVFGRVRLTYPRCRSSAAARRSGPRPVLGPSPFSEVASWEHE